MSCDLTAKPVLVVYVLSKTPVDKSLSRTIQKSDDQANQLDDKIVASKPPVHGLSSDTYHTVKTAQTEGSHSNVNYLRTKPAFQVFD